MATKMFKLNPKMQIFEKMSKDLKKIIPKFQQNEQNTPYINRNIGQITKLAPYISKLTIKYKFRKKCQFSTKKRL